jgi:thiosulfate/3-mercaptopyruvate sulfurtransferase
MLVTTSWLADHLRDPNLVILHVGGPKDYDPGHIPGARLIQLSDISVTGDRGLRLELPTVEALQEAFGRLGVSDDSRIMIYPASDSVQSATRVWFTLDYLGIAGRASLLDGGLPLWKAEGRRLSTETPKPPAQRALLTVRPKKDAVVDAEWVRMHLTDKTVQIVDARAPAYYTGASAGITWRAGRIPGARNVPFSSLLDEQRKLKSADALRPMLIDAAGGQKLTAAYCHLGQQATLVYFAARYLGLDVKLYDGSFQDWSTRPGLPVETGPAPAR